MSDNLKDIQQQSSKQFIIFTLVAAIVASSAAWLSKSLNLEIWMMFAGFITWFTRPTSLQESLNSMLCFYLGILLAILTRGTIGMIVPHLGSLAFPVVVFFVAILIVGLRTTKFVSNMLGWFLGLVTFFAADMDLSIHSLTLLFATPAIGGFAGWSCQTLNRILIKAK